MWTINKKTERIKKNKETEDSQYIYQNELDKACFQHNMVYGDFKDLTKRTTSDKILHDKAFNIAKNPKCDGYQRRLALMVFKLFDKKTSIIRINKFAGNCIKKWEYVRPANSRKFT